MVEDSMTELRVLSTPLDNLDRIGSALSAARDALSAADRPYDKAVPVDWALEHLGSAGADGEVDAELFDLFVQAHVYDRSQAAAFPY